MTEENWGSVADMLDFAIDKEQEAVEFYTDLADRTDRPEMESVFKEFAAMEQGHKSKLEHVKTSGGLTPSSAKVLDLKMADYLVDIEPGPDLDYQQILVIAMKREQAAQNLYADLAAAAENTDIRELLQALSQEEAQHKLRFETEYDDFVMKDN